MLRIYNFIYSVLAKLGLVGTNSLNLRIGLVR